MASLTMNSTRSRAPSGRILQSAASVFRAVTQAWVLHRASVALQSLDDTMLNDIGVARGDIEAAVRYGRAGLSS